MKIESIKIENYKLFKHTEIKKIPSFCVILGTNGAGKSTFFDVFGFLRDSLQTNVNDALRVRGGFKEVISRGCNPDKDFIKIEITFRTTDEQNTSPLVTYELEIGFEKGLAFVNLEIFRYRKGSSGETYNFIEFRKGEGKAIVNENDYQGISSSEDLEFHKLASPDILAIKGLGQFEKFKTVSAFRNLLEKWHVSNFKIESARNIGNGMSDLHLSTTGENLPQVAKYMYEYHRDKFDDMLQRFAKRIPGITSIEPKLTEEGTVLLKFRDNAFENPFLASSVSDGTLKMLAYMILLSDPEPHPLLCIEEPENYLHPEIMFGLCEEIRQYTITGKSQIFVSTHSPDFVNALYIDELFFIEKTNGYSLIKAVKDNPLAVDFVNEGNQLGWLWRNKYIDGINL